MSTPSSVPARIVWAVEQLRLGPRQHLLEIGCGAGHALALVAHRFESVIATGIDRSHLQVERARRLNLERLKDGRMTILPLGLERAARELPPSSYAAALAINVNVFWTEPADSFTAVATLLRPQGQLLLVYQPPSIAAVSRIEGKLMAAATAAGFQFGSASRARAGQSPLLGVVLQGPRVRSRRSK